MLQNSWKCRESTYRQTRSDTMSEPSRSSSRGAYRGLKAPVAGCISLSVHAPYPQLVRRLKDLLELALVRFPTVFCRLLRCVQPLDVLTKAWGIQPAVKHGQFSYNIRIESIFKENLPGTQACCRLYFPPRIGSI